MPTTLPRSYALGLSGVFSTYFVRLDSPEAEANARQGDLEIDFLWRDRRLAIEVDGASFHTALPDRRRDQVKDAALVRSGHAVLRLGWHQIVDEPEATVALIAQMLAKPRD